VIELWPTTFSKLLGLYFKADTVKFSIATNIKIHYRFGII